MTEKAIDFLERLEAAERTLTRLATSLNNGNLTRPDPSTGEQWDLGQLWAHMVEFIPFWQGQVEQVLAGGAEKVSFGRVLTHEGRVLAIERDRAEQTAVLHARLQTHLADLRQLIQSLSSEQWLVQGEHLAMGTMTVEQIIGRFLLGHLESHVIQLKQLLQDN